MCYNYYPTRHSDMHMRFVRLIFLIFLIFLYFNDMYIEARKAQLSDTKIKTIYNQL